jgi:hypothetical protein
MTLPFSSLPVREAVWLFPVAVAIHFSEEVPRFAKWAREHISPLYNDAHWRKIHATGLAFALTWCSLLSVWLHPAPVFAFWAFCFSPMLFNSVFHVAASFFYRSYSPGTLSALLQFPPLFWYLAAVFGKAGLLNWEMAILATIIGAAVHALDLASLTYFVQPQSFFATRNKAGVSQHFAGEVNTQEKI